MQDRPLVLPHLFDRAERLFPKKEIVTATATGRERVTYGEWADAHPAARRRARRPRHLGDGRVGDVRLEHGTSPRAVLRGAVQRPGAAHPEHPAVPRAAHLHRQPRRGRGDLRRPVAARPAVAAGRHVRDGQAHRGDGRRTRRAARGRARVRSCSTTRTCWPRRNRSSGTSTTRTRPRRCVTRAAPPATPRASCTRTARRGCTRWRSLLADSLGAREHDRILPVVPMFHANAWGSRPRRGRVRRHVGDARARPVAARHRRADRGGAGHRRGRRADHLDGRAARAEGSRHLGVAIGPVRWLGRARGRCRRRTASRSACRSSRRGA